VPATEYQSYVVVQGSPVAVHNSPMPEPPVARRLPRIEVVHGEERRDNYFWLRDRNDPEVTAYLEAENAYTNAVMKPAEALEESLYREMLARIKEDDQSAPYPRLRYWYYARTEKGKQYPIYCRRAGSLEAPEQVTLDLNALAVGREYLGVSAYAVSDDGRWLAYSTDVTGFRDYTLYLKDLETGTLLSERFEKVATVAWASDNRTLFYATEDAAKRPYRLWRHRLGADAGEDPLIYEERDALFRVHVWRSRSLAYLFFGSRSFTSGDVRFTRADALGDWRLIAPREKDHEYDVDHGGEMFYIRTNGGGRRNFRLVTAPVDDPRPERWTELVPHRDDVMLDDVDVFADHYVTHERERGLVRLRVTMLGDGLSHYVEFPEPTYDVTPDTNAEFATRLYRFRYQSFVTPVSVYDYDTLERRLLLRKRTEVLGGYDPGRYRSQRLYATSKDGTKVPISIVTPANAPCDGASPLVLAGYGAYGLPYPVTFSSNRLSLLDRGISVAIAHVRGGGELGKRWHDDGRMLAKPNTFADFIAVADYLVAEQWTSRDRLIIEGGSAGGLLVGAVINQRPDLCAGAILRVPFVDVVTTMLDETLPLTVGEFEEWGNPKLREFYECMKSYCPYTNLATRDYPALLVRTSLNDSQVMYWEPAKYVAKMRAFNSQGRPPLFKIDMGAGHGGPSGRYDALHEVAFDYAWLLTLLGHVGEPARAVAAQTSGHG